VKSTHKTDSTKIKQETVKFTPPVIKTNKTTAKSNVKSTYKTDSTKIKQETVKFTPPVIKTN